MIAHVVLLKPRPGFSAADRQALIEAFERAVGEIPTVRGVRVGTRLKHGAGYEPGAPDTADILAILEFDDLAGLQTYLRHPSHEELGKWFGEIARAGGSASAYDFEVGGLESLSKLR